MQQCKYMYCTILTFHTPEVETTIHQCIPLTMVKSKSLLQRAIRCCVNLVTWLWSESSINVEVQLYLSPELYTPTSIFCSQNMAVSRNMFNTWGKNLDSHSAGSFNICPYEELDILHISKSEWFISQNCIPSYCLSLGPQQSCGRSRDKAAGAAQIGRSTSRIVCFPFLFFCHQFYFVRI